MSILLSSPRSWNCYKTESAIIVEKNGRQYAKYTLADEDKFLAWLEEMSGTNHTVNQFKKYGKTEWIDL